MLLVSMVCRDNDEYQDVEEGLRGGKADPGGALTSMELR